MKTEKKSIVVQLLRDSDGHVYSITWFFATMFVFACVLWAKKHFGFDVAVLFTLVMIWANIARIKVLLREGRKNGGDE